MGEGKVSYKPQWPQLGKFWTIPNVLTLLRLVLSVPLAYLVYVDGSIFWILLLLILAMATDWFDGRVARWSQAVSDWGKVLDPLVDKIGGSFVVIAVVLRASNVPGEPGYLPLWLLLLLLVRDLVLVVGGITLGRRTGFVVQSIWSGKAAVSALALTVLAAILRADPEVMRFCVWLTAVLLTYSFLVYFFRFFRYIRNRQQLIQQTLATRHRAAQADEPEPLEPDASTSPSLEA